jgi:tetratricopeptide (TPR) repeat protein
MRVQISTVLRITLACGLLSALPPGVAGPQRLAAQQTTDSAGAAWAAGDHPLARVLYTERVAADSADVQALHRLGLLLAWEREYATAIPLLERVVRMAPSTAARLDLANVLAWHRSYDRALAVLDDVLRTEPSAAALYARARFLSWAGRYDDAAAAYHAILESDPADAEALRGLARVTSWRGDLAGGERLWRKVLEVEPENADAHIGLSQVLRWSGQARPALEHARAAARLRPGDREVLEQLAWAEAPFAVRVAPTLSAEYDSDDNRLFTAVLVATAHPTPRLSLSTLGQLRRAEVAGGPGVPTRETRLALGTARIEVGNGWIISGGAGAVDRPVGGTTAIYRAGFASPGWLPVSATAGYAHNVLDATADLMGRDVTTGESSLTLAVRIVPAVRLEAGGSLTRFDGQTSNDRLLGRLGLESKVNRWLRLRPRVTAFRFENSVQEGYFAPDEYALAEIGIGVDRHRGSWGFSAEVAPGAQRIGSDADFEGALSGRARVGYTIAPGREVGIAFSFSNLGIERFQPGSAGYRYQAAVLSAAWGF